MSRPQEPRDSQAELFGLEQGNARVIAPGVCGAADWMKMPFDPGYIFLSIAFEGDFGARTISMVLPDQTLADEEHFGGNLALGQAPQLRLGLARHSGCPHGNSFGICVLLGGVR